MLKKSSLRRYSLILIAIMATFASGCSKKPAAEVNGAEISNNALEWHFIQRVNQHIETGAVIKKQALRNAVLEQLITQKLLYLGAVEKGIAADDHELEIALHGITQRMGGEDFERRLRKASLSRDEFAEMTRQNLAADKFATALKDENPVTDDEVKDFYQSSPTPFLTPESVNIRFIQTMTRGQAEGLVKEIGKGKDFDKLADKLLEETKAVVQGYSWVNPDFFSAEIAEGLKDLKKGRVDGPFKSKDGYFIFRVKNRKHARVKTLEEASEEIRNMLTEQRGRAAVAHWIAEKKKTVNIDINEP
jgi:parvulin-like peptidyl-prolyl isomerase